MKRTDVQTPADIEERTAEPSGRQVPFLGLTLGVVAVGVEGLVVSPVLHDVATAFGTSPAQAGWAVSAYGLTLAVVAPIIGLWGDHISRKTTMTTGLCLFVIAGLLCALSTTFWMLAAARAACGAAAGAFLPSCYAYVGDSTAYAERGRVMGRVMAGWSVSLILGIPIGGAIAQIWGWRATFVAVSALGCVAAFLVARMPSVAPQRVPGLSVTTAASLVFSNGVPRLMLVNFLDMLSFYGVYTFLGVVVLERLSVGSGVFGLFVLCYGVGLMLSTMNARVLDRFGKEKVLMPALALLGILLLILIPATYQPVALAGCMLIWGVLQGIVQTGTATIITQASDKARGFGMACMSCTTYMAVGLGALGGGWLHSTHGFGALALAGALAALLASLVLHGYKAIQPPSPPVCTSQT